MLAQTAKHELPEAEVTECVVFVECSGKDALCNLAVAKVLREKLVTHGYDINALGRGSAGTTFKVKVCRR